MSEIDYRKLWVVIPVVILNILALLLVQDPWLLGISGEAVFQQKEYYRLASGMFLHAGIVHLCTNMIMLTATAYVFTEFHSAWSFYIIYLLSGLLGGLLMAGIRFLLKSPVITVGASGACMGILGADLATIFKNRSWMSKSSKFNYLRGLLILSLVNLIPKESGVDYLGHLCGFMIGFLLILIFTKKGEPRTLTL